MNTTTPTLDEWRQLYEAAARFKEAVPWEWMTESHVFGVRHPETGEIGYDSIMGLRGEYFALAVYLGSEGLAGFVQMESGRAKDATFLLEIPQLQASFGDRQELRKEDLAIIKSLGLKFRGQGAWLLFRSYVPGYLPWLLSGEEARFLTVCLEQGLEVALRLRADPHLLDPLRQGLYLIRTLDKEGTAMVWKDQWEKPVPPQPKTIQIKLDQKLLNAVARLPRQPMTMQASLFVMPGGIFEKGDPRPYFGYTLMVVEAQSGFILGTEILAPKPSLEAVWTQTPEEFLKVLPRLGTLPTEVAVNQERLRMLLEPVTTALGIKLTLTRTLPALNQARKAMEQMLYR
jgi:hypothetical protein